MSLPERYLIVSDAFRFVATDIDGFISSNQIIENRRLGITSGESGRYQEIGMVHWIYWDPTDAGWAVAGVQKGVEFLLSIPENQACAFTLLEGEVE